jgi:transposase
MAGRWELTEEQWEAVEPVLREARRGDNRGRPWHDTRAVLNGVLWVLGTGAQWRELPEKHPPFQTCHRRFQQWIRSGKLEAALKLLARHLYERGKLNLDEAFVDATFASAKKGASPSAPPVAARAPRSSLSPLVTVFLSPYLSKALRLLSASLWKRFLPEVFSTNSRPGSSATKPTTRTRSIKRSKSEYGIELIAPNRRGRKRRTQDGRKLRRYRRRWNVERLFAWMHNFRRLVTRWEYHIENFLGFLHLACLHFPLFFGQLPASCHRRLRRNSELLQNALSPPLRCL